MFRRGLVLWIALALLSFSLFAAAQATEPWDTPFNPDTGAIMARAAAVTPPDDSPVVLLLADGLYSFDAAGRMNSSYRLVYKILNASAIDGWSSIDTQWSPWFEEHPTMRARVISPDGSVHELDPKTIAEAPANDAWTTDVYNDDRILQAPLPAIGVGAIVEEHIVTRETAPMFDRGVTTRFYFGGQANAQRIRLRLDAPPEVALRYAAKGIDIKPVVTKNNNRTQYLFERAPMPKNEPVEAYSPLHVVRAPYVVFSTGKSWQEIAARYSGIVDSKLASSDLRAYAAAAIGNANDRDARIARLLAALHRDVRYTGIEFGDASIIPRTPDETMQRRYGDCKDKATLLVGLLRAAGIPAHVALLDTAFRTEIDVDLPGFGEFDHAIVYVPGPQPLWIDATDEFARFNEIPVMDQGRLALVASPESAGLVRVPELPSSSNATFQRRDFFLTESGGVRIVETTEYRGLMETGERDDVAYSEAKDLREAMKSYVKAVYVADDVASLEYGDAHDLSKPMKRRVEVVGAEHGKAVDGEASIAIYPSDLFGSLPSMLRPGEETDGAEADEKEKKPRKNDFLIFQPYVSEITYAIAPAAGFAAEELPEPETRTAGSAKYSREFKRGDDGTVVATLRFDSGKRRLVPAELEPLKKLVADAQAEEPISVTFRQIGEAHLAAGRVAEALAEFRRLAALHPTEALHHSQVAMALLQGGMGEEARKEALAAVELEPKSAKAWTTFGWILQHDLVGRRFKKGFDMTGAVAAYRKAKELDPGDFIARGDLAILVEHDARGARYGGGARLAEAIEEYKAIRTDLKEQGMNANLLAALMWARRFKELKETADAMPAFANRDDYRLIGTAGSSGTDATLRLAAKIHTDTDQRRAALERVGNTLVQLRMYPEASVLLLESVKGGDAAQKSVQIDTLRKTVLREKIALPENDPTTVVKKLVVALYTTDEAKLNDEVLPLFSRAAQEELRNDKSSSLAGEARKLRRAGEALGLPVDVIVDVAMGTLNVKTDGSEETGFRLRVTAPNSRTKGGEMYFITREEGKYRIAATGRTTHRIGSEVLRRVDAGDLAGAKQWLEWAREELPTFQMEDDYLTTPFARFWEKDSVADAARMKLAAAALLVSGPSSDAMKVAPMFVKARQSASTDDERYAIDATLAYVYSFGEMPKEFLEVAERLRPRMGDSEMLFHFTCGALEETTKHDEVEKLCAQRLAKRADDPAALRGLSLLAFKRNEVDAGGKYLQQLIDAGEADADDFEKSAWLSMFKATPDESAIEAARRAVSMSSGNARSPLHTLAALYAHAGKTSEAREIIYQSLEASDGGEPEAFDWVVFGRIAEQYGEKTAAANDYRKVTKPEDDDELAISNWEIARRRLEILGVRK